MWKGVGYNIDSAFQYRDGKTYFFKGKGYWRFNDLRMSVDQADPHPSAPHWMKCQQHKVREPMVDVTTEDQEDVITSGVGGLGPRTKLGFFALTALLVVARLRVY